MKIIENALDRTAESYKKMFEIFIPKMNHGAFHEANQTYYFCGNLVDELNSTIENNKAVASLEVAIKENGKSKRIDGVVVSPATKEIFYIESKRLENGNTGTKGKRQAVFDDIKKIINAERENLIKDMLPTFYSDFSQVKQYIVILADLWIEGNRKNRNEIPFWWCGEDKTKQLGYFKDITEKFGKPSKYFIEEEQAKKLNWSFDNQYIKRFSEYEMLPKKSALPNYCLLAGCAELV